MLLKQLEYFITVVDCHSFSEAANICYISQSAISQQIKSLEKELGVDLMIRSNRSFKLTPAGEYMYRHGKSVLKDVKTLKEETIRRGEDNELSLTIGYPKNYIGKELQHAILKFTNIYPEVKIMVITGNHEELFHKLLAGNIDLKLSEQRRVYDNNYINYELKYSDCYIEVSNKQEFNNDYVTVEDLKDISCIIVASVESQESEREFFENTLRISNKFIFADNIEQARMLVLSNRGYLPIDVLTTLPEEINGIKRIPLYYNDKPIKRNYFLCWEKEHTNYYIEEFAKMLKETL